MHPEDSMLVGHWLHEGTGYAALRNLHGLAGMVLGLGSTVAVAAGVRWLHASVPYPAP
jgi:hypothetical protein